MPQKTFQNAPEPGGRVDLGLWPLHPEPVALALDLDQLDFL